MVSIIERLGALHPNKFPKIDNWARLALALEAFSASKGHSFIALVENNRTLAVQIVEPLVVGMKLTDDNWETMIGRLNKLKEALGEK